MTNSQAATKDQGTLSPIIVPWRITKARTDESGRRTWEATTSKFSRDQQGDLVTPEFYKTAIGRFKSGASPAPFFSVAHYPTHEVCECGAAFKTLVEEKCSVCKTDRLQAGLTTDMWVDGKQPKAKGYFFDNELGREVYKSCRDDVEKKIPYDESIRVSMGFYPDPNGVRVPANGQRDFLSGWVEHFAGTRVPVVPEAALTTKSLSIKTRYDDALAVVRSKTLADKLSQLTGRRLKSDVEDELILKSEEKHQPGKHDQKTHAGQAKAAFESWFGKGGEGRASRVHTQLDGMGMVTGLPKNVAKAIETAKQSMMQAMDVESKMEDVGGDLDLVEDGFDIMEKAENDVTEAFDAYNKWSKTTKSSAKDKDGQQTGETAESDQDDHQEDKSEAPEETDVAMIDDPLMQEANDALSQVQKAIAAPGGNKAQILSLAANLVSAIRDYAHTLASTTTGEIGAPAGMMDPNAMLPPNQPLPPDGQVIDQTMDPMNLAPKPEDAVVPSDPLANDALPPELIDANGPPTTEEELLAEGAAAKDPNAPVDEEDEIPLVPMPEEYNTEEDVEVDGEEEVVPEEEDAAPSPEEETEETTEEDEEEPDDEEKKKEKKKLKFGKKPEAKAIRLTDLMYKHLPGKHDQMSHGRAAKKALDSWKKAGQVDEGKLQEIQATLSDILLIDGLPKNVETAVKRADRLSSKLFNIQHNYMSEGREGDQEAEVEIGGQFEDAIDNALKLFEDAYGKKPNKKSEVSTSVGERVKERAMPNAAVKSASEHPAEVFMQVWSSGVAKTVGDSQLTRQQKLEAVQKSLTEFKSGVLNLIEETTPVTDSDVQAYVKSEVEKAVAEIKAAHEAEKLQLEAKVVALTRSAVDTNVQQVIKAVTSKGRLQRKSFSQPNHAPVAPQAPVNGAPVLSGDVMPIRKATAAEVAAASVAAGPTMLFRY